MKKVFAAQDPLVARLILGVLEQNGIRATIQGDLLWGARGELPFTPDSGPSVWIADDEDEERALALIREHDAPADPQFCPTCGYNLYGLPDPRCPECGEPFRRSEKLEKWVCPGCGEKLAGQFTECWNCGHSRDDA